MTTARALGREDRVRVRGGGDPLDAELAGWDPTTGIVVLRVPGLGGQPIEPASSPARVGHLALAVARSWSNALTASAGIVAVIGGPLRTGRHRAIEQVIRTTAPMHDGFAGGALLDASGRLFGMATAAAIRGYGVVIPIALARQSAAEVLQHGGLKRGYLGIAGQTVQVPDHQRPAGSREQAMLVAAVTNGSPAQAAGVLVGDLLFEFDGQPVDSPEALLELLAGNRVNKDIDVRILRGGTIVNIKVHVAERPRA
jgi:S1-C subfamily serine protease